MILRRLGCKNKLISTITKHFPNFNTLISPFYGTGAIENTYIGKIKYLYANDIDNNIFNLFTQIKDNYQELLDQLELIPYHEKIFNQFKKSQPKSNTEKSIQFLYLSNFSYLGKSDTLKFCNTNSKRILINNLKETYKLLVNNPITTVQFFNTDFRTLFNKINFRHESEKQSSFIYADPPYLYTKNNYNIKWTEQDFKDLIQTLINTNIKFAISEFDNDFINQFNLNKIYISERQSLKNRNTEILLTNYKLNTLF